jgi:hypothetical protein
MKEIVLRYFFEGHATADELALDLVGTRDGSEPPGFRSSANYAVLPMAAEFTVQPPHLLRLVDAALAGQLTPDDLGTICFVLEFSDRFGWDGDTPDGERVSDAVFWLGMPEVNYPLTPAVLAKIRHYVVTGVDTLTPADAAVRVD